MVIKNIMTHSPMIGKIEEEGDVKTLLADLRRDFACISENYPGLPLNRILEIAEEESLRIDKGIGILNEIDLSEVQGILSEYRRLSEGGCSSCVHRGIVKPYPDETNVYCKLNETAKTVNDRTGQSQMVKKYLDNENCPELEHRFKKTIEELIWDGNC